MTHTLDTIVFDMGNVLMTFDSMHFSRIFTSNEEDAALLNRALFDRFEWALLDAGAIGHDTIQRIAEEDLVERLHPNLHECLAHWPECSRPIAAVNELVPRLKERGYRLYLLSNASTRIDEQLNHCPAYPYMDGRVVSAEERVMKPDPSIYEILCRRYDLDPTSCLFVDDNLNNCRGAEVTGMRAFHFVGDPAAAAVELARILDLA